MLRKWIGYVFAVVLSAPSFAAANDTHKTLARWELNAKLTCTKAGGGENLELEVLAKSLRRWLVRVSDDSAIIAQDVKEIAVASVKKGRRSVLGSVTFRKSGTEDVELRNGKVSGTDLHAQDRSLWLADCARVKIETHEPPPRSKPSEGVTAD